MKLLLVLLAFLTFQDKQLPEYGDISDLKGMTKVYVTADSTESRKWILDELKKSTLMIVPSEDEAEFIIKCVRLTEEGQPIGDIVRMPGQFEMTVYTMRNGRQRIAWSKTKSSMRPAPKLLTGDFLGALKKSQK